MSKEQELTKKELTALYKKQKEHIKKLEEKLKAFEIIKKKGVSFVEIALIVSCKSYEEYCIEMKSNRVYLTSYERMKTLKTQEEFDLLKEELLWN